MANTKTILVPARSYEDHDDSLAAAAEQYAAQHDLETWEVTASWHGGEDGEREQIALEVPAVRIDDNDISSLCHEASEAGDEEQVELCERALAGDSAARQACVAAILAARAQS